MLLELFTKWLGLLWEPIAPAMPAMITSFFSVLVGAMPFIVIAVFASALLEVFVSKDTIARLVPSNGTVGVFAAPLMGALIPMCECGIIPVARRKGRHWLSRHYVHAGKSDYEPTCGLLHLSCLPVRP